MKRLITAFILLTVVFLYTKPYFRSGFFSTHDGEWAIVRLSEMVREVKDIQIPPRWSDYLNHGFGYPLFSFTYPAPYYLGIVLKLFGFSLTDSIKILFFGSVVLSAFFMHLLGRELAGEWGGVFAAIFYTVAPFRLVDLYVRGSLGESLSFSLFPLIFYLILKYIQKPTVKYFIASSFVLALLILTHNVTAFLFFPILLIFLPAAAKFYKKDLNVYSWRYFLPLIILSCGLSAYFFLPAILEKKYLILSNIKLADVSTNFVRFTDYFISRSKDNLQPSYQLGIANIIAAFIALTTIGFLKERRKKYAPFFLFIISTILILVFLASPYSLSFWEAPPLSWFDFPWRLLTPLTFIISFAAIFLGLTRLTKTIGIFLAILAVFLNLEFVSPGEYIHKPDAYYATNDATTTSMDELMPVWVKNKPKDRYSNKVEVIFGQASISNLKYNSKMASFDLAANIPSTIRINTVYFPGWQITVNNKKVFVDYSSLQGLMYFAVNPGDYQVMAKFTETPVRLLADLISIISIGAVVILLVSPKTFYEKFFK